MKQVLTNVYDNCEITAANVGGGGGDKKEITLFSRAVAHSSELELKAGL